MLRQPHRCLKSSLVVVSVTNPKGTFPSPIIRLAEAKRHSWEFKLRNTRDSTITHSKESNRRISAAPENTPRTNSKLRFSRHHRNPRRDSGSSPWSLQANSRDGQQRRRYQHHHRNCEHFSSLKQRRASMTVAVARRIKKGPPKTVS